LTAWPAAAVAAIAAAALAFACGGGSSSPSPNTTTTIATTTSTAPASTTTSTIGATTTTVPALTARFTVTSLSAAQRKTNNDPNPVTILPAGTADACPLVNSSNPVLDCRFDASTSTGPIAVYKWTYSFGTKKFDEDTTTPQLKPTAGGCGFFGGQSGSSGGGLQFINMKVDLQVRDATGNLAAVFTDQNVRIFPAGLCGYGF
jgi:hypothetical protein